MCDAPARGVVRRPGRALALVGAVAVQSAGIDSVSGATYTSSGYKQSLQSAIDRAGL